MECIILPSLYIIIEYLFCFKYALFLKEEYIKIYCSDIHALPELHHISDVS